MILTMAIVFQWATMICDAREYPNPDARCMAYVSSCIVFEYNKTNDPDSSFEQCAESVPGEWIRG